jgi:hypothetical protein
MRTVNGDNMARADSPGDGSASATGRSEVVTMEDRRATLMCLHGVLEQDRVLYVYD